MSKFLIDSFRHIAPLMSHRRLLLRMRILRAEIRLRDACFIRNYPGWQSVLLLCVGSDAIPRLAQQLGVLLHRLLAYQTSKCATILLES